MEFVRDNILLIAVAVTSGLMLVWPSIMRLISGAQEVNTFQATQLINQRDALVLDVREQSEFDRGHIPNSKHIPLGALEKRLNEIKKHKGKPVVVNCRSGNRSLGACGVLKKLGFEEVYVLRGGMLAWEQANLPVEKK